MNFLSIAFLATVFISTLLFLLFRLKAALERQRIAVLELQKSEDIRNKIFESSKTPIVILDPETQRFIDCNPAAVECYGHRFKEETVGKTPKDVSAPFQYDGTPSCEKVSRIIREALEKGAIVFEWLHQRPDGVHWDAEVHLMSLQFGEKALLQFSLVDIAKRKKTHEALMASERRFAELIQNSFDVVVLLDADGVQRYVSPSAERVLGYSASELMGIRVSDTMIHPDDRAMVQTAFRTIIETGAGGVQYRHRYKAGGWVHLEARGVNQLHNPDILGVVVNVRDITDRKRVEEALEKRIVALTQPLTNNSGIRFEDLFNVAEIQRLQDEFAEATQVASVITRPDGIPITAPSNFCRLCTDIIRKTKIGCANCHESDAVIGQPNPLGPTLQRCLSAGLWDAGSAISVGGHHIANWLVGQIRDETQDETVIRDYARVIGANEADAVEAFREVPKMSRQQFQKIADALFTLSNQLSHSAYQNVQQARFISERQEVEKALKTAKEQAEAANQAKSEFLSNMSHELRTPMNGVLGFAEILQYTELNSEQQKYVEIIERSGKNLLSIINDILDFSKIEAGRMNLEILKVDIIELLQQTLELMNYPASTKGLQMLCSIDPEIPRFAMVDSGRVRQILVNLLSNALKFTKTGEVELKASLVQREGRRGRIRFSVRDTGIGIAEEQEKKLFKAFSQGDGSITRNYGGTGLGLVISDQLAQLMGSKIEYVSTQGVGSEFFFSIETDLEEAQEIKTVKQSDASTGSLVCLQAAKILIAEDDAVNMMVASVVISKLVPAADIIKVGNGKDALDKFIDLQPDLVFMDLQMSEMDGFEATRRIRAIEQERGTEKAHAIPIIALTAFAMQGDREACIAAGMDDYIAKPFDAQQLAATLRKWLPMSSA